jgi:sulfate adenylyltransferase
LTEPPAPPRAEPTALWLDREAARQARADARGLRSWDLDPRQLAEIELLLSGALAPLEGYLDGATHDLVLRSGALADGSACPWPLALDVGEDFAAETRSGETIALRDPEGLLVALLDVSDVFRPSPERLERALFAGPPLLGAEPDAGRDWLYGERPFRLGGRLRGIEPVYHYDFASLRLPPDELRQRIARRGWRRVLAVLTRRPLGPGELALVERRARELEADVLLLAEAGMAEAGSLRYYARMRALEAALPRFGEQAAEAAIVSLPRPLGSARERTLRQLVARNHGATHVLLLDDLPDAPTEAVPEGVTAVPGGRMVHVPERGLYCLEDECEAGDAAQPCDIGALVDRMVAGERIPEWLGWPEVVDALRRAWPPRASQGFTLFLTGLSGSGKSTIARALLGRLMEEGSRRVTLLDGDIVRKNLSSELGFSREHRDLNIRRIGFVAAEITKNGGVAICAPIAPYATTRRAVRDAVERVGGFVEIHVATPLEVCEARDRKGLYAKARAGVIKEFTGISDPYEAPGAPELRIDTAELSPDEAAQRILLKLRSLGYMGSGRHG